jgi:hypothetical protein
MNPFLYAVALILGVLPASLPAAPASKNFDPKTDGKNLVPNGDFEEGGESPKGWQTVDGLTSFYVKDEDPKHGKCIRFDTDVQQGQAYDWWAKYAEAESHAAFLDFFGEHKLSRRFKTPSPKEAPKKLPTVEPKYDTIAGNDGVWFWSDYFPIEKGKAYWLTLDAKGAGMMVWLVGYPERHPVYFGSEAKALIGFMREQRLPKNSKTERGHESIIARYVFRGQMSVGGSDKWQTFSRKDKLFRPTKQTPDVRWGRILILPFWPPGEYYVDNVRLVEVPDPEAPKTDE